MKRITGTGLGILIVILAACTTVYNAVTSDYDRSVDFSKYKTFAWLADKADTSFSPYNNQIIRNNIRNYFGLCMSDRGYTVNLDQPDLLLQLIIMNAKKERVITTYTPVYYYHRYYYGSYYYSPYLSQYYYHQYLTYPNNYLAYPGYTSIQKQEYVNGAIILNLIDRKANKLVWTGTAEGDIYDPSMISHDLHPSVHKLLKKYPIRPLVNRGHTIK